MRAEIEPLSGIVRVFRDDAVWGDPYDMSLVFIANEGIVTLKALQTRGIDKAHADAIRVALRDAGFREARWRRGNGRTIRVPLQ